MILSHENTTTNRLEYFIQSMSDFKGLMSSIGLCSLENQSEYINRNYEIINKFERIQMKDMDGIIASYSLVIEFKKIDDATHSVELKVWNNGVAYLSDSYLVLLKRWFLMIRSNKYDILAQNQESIFSYDKLVGQLPLIILKN